MAGKGEKDRRRLATYGKEEEHEGSLGWSKKGRV